MTRLVRRPARICAAFVSALTIGIIFGLYPVLGAGPDGENAPSPNRAVTLRPEGVVPGQYIVVFHDEVSEPGALAGAMARQHGFTLRQSYAHALKGFAARLPAAVAEALAGDPAVAFVEPDE